MASLLAACAALQAGDTGNDTGARAAFERIKTLKGEWQSSNKSGPDRLVYSLTAGGSALLEREMMGGEGEMLSVYHLDGDRLILTHYCMAQNQPRMQSRGFDAKTGALRFEFLDITNATTDATHLHQVTMRIKDDDHLAMEWQGWDKGKAKETETVEFTRVK
jgi:DNA-binding PadR family transcriptional regulator